jgi:mannose-1-phosphate guanylyltransferase
VCEHSSRSPSGERSIAPSSTLGSTCSIERDVFPALSDDGTLYALALPGHFLDIGTRTRYLQAHIDLLHREGRARVEPSSRVSDDAQLIAPVAIDADAQVEGGARVGPGVYIGQGARVGAGAIVSWSAVLAGADIAAHARVDHAIVAPGIGSLAASD